MTGRETETVRVTERDTEKEGKRGRMRETGTETGTEREAQRETLACPKNPRIHVRFSGVAETCRSSFQGKSRP